MKNLLLALLLFAPVVMRAQTPVEKYPVDSASVEHKGVPKGEILKCTFSGSKIYPGTLHEFSIYIPAQYDGKKPACVFIDQDGIQFKSPTVFDNLINSGEMPVTIGIYIAPGRVVAKDTTTLDRYNRSFEYDGLGDAYARFLLEELLPDVEKRKTTKGLPIMLSHNGNDRMIAGTSSGAVCAFTAAWERPDAFSRVFSGIGTYVSLRGADHYPGLIRKYEPKPIKIFLQDGSHDQNAYGGDWFYANQMMERALTFAGYQVNHAWGEGAHSGTHSTAIFAEAMRWLWKDYPAPIVAGKSKNPFLDAILIDGEGWKQVGEELGLIGDLQAEERGSINFTDFKTNKTYYVNPDNKLVLPAHIDKKIQYIAVHNKLPPVNTKFVVTYVTDSNIDHFTISGNDVITAKQPIEFYETGSDGTTDAGKLFLIKKDHKRVVLDKGINHPYGLALTPDHSQLYVTEEGSHWVWLFNINPDGTLANKQRYGWLHMPDTTESAQPRGIQVDREGRVYVATNLGIQVLDQAGRVNAILPLPTGAGPATALCFGGSNFNVLYVTCGNKLYQLKLKIKGMNDFDAPVKPAKPRL